MSDMRPGRGRPKGTGLDDSAQLKAIAALMVATPGLKPTTAIRELGVTDPSVIRRLRDKFHAVEADLLTAAGAGTAEAGSNVMPAAIAAQQSTQSAPARTMAQRVKRDAQIVAPAVDTASAAAKPSRRSEGRRLEVVASREIPRPSPEAAEAPVPAPAAAPAVAAPLVATPAVEATPVLAPVATGNPEFQNSRRPAPDLSFARLTGLGMAIFVSSVEAQASVLAYCLRQAPVHAFVQTQVALAEAALSLTASALPHRRTIA